MSVHDMRKSLMLSNPPLVEAMSHRSVVSPGDDTTPRFIDGARTECRMQNEMLPKSLQRLRPRVAGGEQKELWTYVFELEKQIMEYQVKLKSNTEESALDISMCSRIKDEATVIKQDLEHQIEALTLEVSNKDIQIEQLTRYNQMLFRSVGTLPAEDHVWDNNSAEDRMLALRGNLSPRDLSRIRTATASGVKAGLASSPIIEAGEKKGELLNVTFHHRNGRYSRKTEGEKKLRPADTTLDLSFETIGTNATGAGNRSFFAGQMDASAVSEIIPDATSTTQTCANLHDILKKMTTPSMDLKILLSRADEEPQQNQSKSTECESCAMMRETNVTLQSHVRQLLEEKRELAEFTTKAVESAEEEKRLLEARMQELSSELDVSRSQKIAGENEEISEVRKIRETIEDEKKNFSRKKSLFNKKLAKLKEIQAQQVKKEEELKELDMKMRVKQKKLFFKKQALENEVFSPKLHIGIVEGPGPAEGQDPRRHEGHRHGMEVGRRH